jgi:hypothetical protein
MSKWQLYATGLQAGIRFNRYLFDYDAVSIGDGSNPLTYDGNWNTRANNETKPASNIADLPGSANPPVTDLPTHFSKYGDPCKLQGAFTLMSQQTPDELNA